MATATTAYPDPNGTPDPTSRAASHAAIRAKIRQAPAAVDHNGSPITPKADPEPVAVPDAIGMTEPATALAVLKAADRLGIDHATVNRLLDSAAFVATVTGASADEVTAAITARTAPRMAMAPNPGQGSSGNGPGFQPAPTTRDKIHATLDHANAEPNLGPRFF